MHNIAFEALYLPFISPNLAALLKGQSLEAGLSPRAAGKNIYWIAFQDIRLCFDTATFNEKHAYESYILPEKNFTKT